MVTPHMPATMSAMSATPNSTAQATIDSVLHDIQAGEDTFTTPSHEDIEKRRLSRRAMARVALVKEHERLLRKALEKDFALIDKEYDREMAIVTAARARFLDQATRTKQDLEDMKKSRGFGLALLCSLSLPGKVEKDGEQETIEAGHVMDRCTLTADGPGSDEKHQWHETPTNNYPELLEHPRKDGDEDDEVLSDSQPVRSAAHPRKCTSHI
ncbi:uncharacterized protein B0I36DRAFT_385433 [Microdochium trichocladiopsis]|uniref:Sds3-like-domain-containing protein n=1 Tax=Microdochium trichocladiopsis TaxID=1682393 RepID=A0A9P8Y1F0_9PEZI|nr:uncharacterized protein B0I36DRAFT_385433 [Microdochium trichocladiopsis]KAH7027420.1 hypothetical protein B0I36DRAFT_385433 [Microdochium trichocladiopsis]